MINSSSLFPENATIDNSKLYVQDSEPINPDGEDVWTDTSE